MRKNQRDSALPGKYRGGSEDGMMAREETGRGETQFRGGEDKTRKKNKVFERERVIRVTWDLAEELIRGKRESRGCKRGRERQ
jgi:hypothetical protein